MVKKNDNYAYQKPQYDSYAYMNSDSDRYWRICYFVGKIAKKTNKLVFLAKTVFSA